MSESVDLLEVILTDFNLYPRVSLFWEALA